MRIASFNMENLFRRAAVLNLPSSEASRKVLNLVTEINDLFEKDPYSNDDKKRIVKILTELGLDKTDQGKKTALAQLQVIRGELLVRHRVPAGAPADIEIKATGRSSFVGWVELKIETVKARATENTALVVREAKPDILGVVEVENRQALQRFSSELLKDVGGTPFNQVMVIDGNDDRGIDVGIGVGPGYRIRRLDTHIFDTDAQGVIFSRDCAEYEVETPGSNRIVLLVNHFKSKGFGSQASNDAKRKRQSTAVANIYNQLIANGVKNVAVVGDLNGAPTTDPLVPLVANTTLTDIFKIQGFNDGGFPGTFGNCGPNDKLDYILLSPALKALVTGGGVIRQGIVAGPNGKKFNPFPTISGPQDAASDHAAIYAEINLP
jgi:endonuclease/exonuclease/phosphatase family metal-dependent hydrolase